MTTNSDNVIEEMLYKLELRHMNLLALQAVGNFPRINLYPEIYEVEAEIRRLEKNIRKVLEWPQSRTQS